MFDICDELYISKLTPDVIDADDLARSLETLSDNELLALEDELDFCSFSGAPSPRILSLLERLNGLDAGWQRLLQNRREPQVPAAY